MTVLTEGIGAILDNFADAIEGGNSYRGSGTAYNGIPSMRSFEDREVTGESATSGSTTTAQLAGISAATAAQMVRTDGPPFFLLCTAQTAGTGNTGAARPITSHDSVDTFTVAPAFAEAVASGDTFSVVEGFKRMGDVTDIEDLEDGIPGMFDRTFSLAMLPGKRLGWYGTGFEMYESELSLHVRILKKGRERTARQSLLENIQTMRTILTRLSLRGDYVQLVDILETQPEVTVDDQYKVVVADKYRVKYRLNATYL